MNMLSHCEKYRVATGFYLFQKKGKIAIKPQENGLRNQERIQKSVMQG